MARIESDPNYTTPTFSRATAATDPFKKEDIQALAAAMSTHIHDGAGKGLAIVAASIPNGSITTAKIADGTIVTADLAANAVSQWMATTIATVTTTTSASYVDVAGMQLTLTTTGGSVLVLFVAQVSNSSAAAGITVGLNDGVSDGWDIGVTVAGISYAVPMVTFGWYGAPSAGAHTWGARWKTNMGTASMAQRTLMVLELKR